MPLDEELKTFADKLPELLAERGKFVVIHGQQIIGIFDTYADAIQAGYECCQLQPFLVKQVEEDEPVHFIGMALCRA